MPVYEFEGLVPVIDPTAFVHDTASVVGDVVIGPGCYIGPFASLRGDSGRIVVGEGSNVQDNSVLHTFPGRETRLDPASHIGHSVTLHGCRIGSYALVGIGSVVLDGAEIGENALVGAGSLVTSGARIAPGVLAHGRPAREVRELTAEELDWKRRGVHSYQDLARRSLATLRVASPLAELSAERDAMRVPAESLGPLSGALGD